MESSLTTDSPDSRLEVPNHICNVCSEVEARYRCPRCGIRSCSVSCIKQHKSQQSCNGVRDKTAYVSLKEFDNINLLSDYRFLEEVGRKTDNLKRYRPRVRNGPTQRAIHLQTAARKRGTRLRLLPYNFTRRRKNTSFFSFRDQEVSWCVDWVFPQANTSYTMKQASEKLCLHECMEKMLAECDAIHRHSLESYVTDGLSNWNYLLKPAVATQRCVRLEGDKSLMENVTGQTLVEYPVIMVVLGRDLRDYIIDTDDAQTQSGCPENECDKDATTCRTGCSDKGDVTTGMGDSSDPCQRDTVNSDNVQ